MHFCTRNVKMHIPRNLCTLQKYHVAVNICVSYYNYTLSSISCEVSWRLVTGCRGGGREGGSDLDTVATSFMCSTGSHSSPFTAA